MPADDSSSSEKSLSSDDDSQMKATSQKRTKFSSQINTAEPVKTEKFPFFYVEVSQKNILLICNAFLIGSDGKISKKTDENNYINLDEYDCHVPAPNPFTYNYSQIILQMINDYINSRKDC